MMGDWTIFIKESNISSNIEEEMAMLENSRFSFIFLLSLFETVRLPKLSDNVNISVIILFNPKTVL